jgi:hypothetical protein
MSVFVRLGDSFEIITETASDEDFLWLAREDIQACLLYAARMVGREPVEPVLVELVPDSQTNVDHF